MAEEEDKNEGDGNSDEETAPKSKKGILLGSGIASLVATAYVVVMVALPGSSEPPPFDGPFTIPLTPESIQVNLRGEGGKGYLNMALSIKYDSYMDTYVTARIADPVYQADLKDVLILIGRHKTREELDQNIGVEVFKAEVMEGIMPLVFPVHVGNEMRFDRAHEESGIGAGTSIAMSTMRGGFKAHMIHLDTMKESISLDEGPEVSYTGNETDLMLETNDGLTVYVDVSKLEKDFVGDINVGTFGRLLGVRFDNFITQ